MKLLDETTALSELRSMLAAAPSAKVAVAFWGKGAIESLGLDRPDLELEILCNLDSGACNPDELKRLRALPNVSLWAHPTLHAKIYWTPGGAIVGSSNASGNGLVVEGAQTGWREANIHLTEAGIVGEVKARIEALFKQGYEVDDEAIARCVRLWNMRAKLTPTGARLSATLFEAYAAAPRHRVWSRVKITFSQDDLGATQKDWLQGEIDAGRIAEDTLAYAEWNDRIEPGDQLIDFAPTSRGATFEGIWLAESSFAAEKQDMRLVRRTPKLTAAGLGRFALTKAEQQALAGLKDVVLARASTDGGRNAIIGFSDAMAILADRTRAPDQKGFERAMRRIYDEASKFNYRPFYLLEAIENHGAVQGARRLVHGDATKGFLRLATEGRLDLSVERLILEPEWEGLFEDADKQTARRRLVQYGYSFADSTGSTSTR